MSSPTNSAGYGNSVNTESGNFTRTFTDFSLPGYGPNLDLTRTYNSLMANPSLGGVEGMFGWGWRSSYDANLAIDTVHNTATITDADGSQVTSLPLSGSTYPLPDWADSSLTVAGGTYTYVEHQTTTMTFNSSGQLTSITDLHGATTNLTYSSGKLYQVTDPAGRSLTFVFSGSLVSSVTDPMGREFQYGYASGNLTSVTDPLSYVTTFGYDSYHYMTSLTLPNGQSGGPDAGDDLVNTYDTSTGQVLTQTDPNGTETTFTYAGSNSMGTGGSTTIQDSNGNDTTDAYASGQLQTDSTAASSTIFGYDQSNYATTSVTDLNDNTTQSTVNSSGVVTTSIDPLQNESTYAYNSFNEQTCAAQPLATAPTNQCGVTGSSLSPPSAITAGGSISAPSAPPAYVTYTAYDTHGNEIYTTSGDYSPSGTLLNTRTTYNLYNGNSVMIGSTTDSCTTSAPSTELPCATIDANGIVTQLTYDSYGDLTSKSTPDGNSGGEVAKTTYTYNTDGQQTSTVAPDGNLSGANTANYTTETAYNADGEVTSVTRAYGSGLTVVPRVTSYGYDGDGNRTTTSQSTSVHLIGTTSANTLWPSASLTFPTGTKPGDEAILSTTMSKEPYLSTFAGLGSPISPSGVAVTSSGDLYFADSARNQVDEIPAASGTQWGISMTAGDTYKVAGSSGGTSGYSGDTGSATSALLHGPKSVALDSSGNLYIADATNNVIREVAQASGTQWGVAMTAAHIYTVAGSYSGYSGDGGPAASARLDDPIGITVDSSDDLYIADSLNNAIREVASSGGSQWGISMTAGDIYTVAGGTGGTAGDGGLATSADLNSPASVALDSSGDLYIADFSNSRIQEVAASSGTNWGTWMNANDVYTIAGDAAGSYGLAYSGIAASSEELEFPSSVATDSSGNVYVTEAGDVLEIAASTGTQWKIAMTAGDMYVVAGHPGSVGASGDGTPPDGEYLEYATGLAVDPSACN